MEQVLKTSEEQMQKALDYFQEKLKAVRTGKANPEIFDRIKISYYGSEVSLKEVATISAKDGRSLVIQPFDLGNLKAIKEAISNSDLNLTPTDDGKLIRINLPLMTKENREKEAKRILKESEILIKVPIRNIRKNGMDKLKKIEELSEDDKKRIQEKLEELTKKFNKQAEVILENKVKDIKTI